MTSNKALHRTAHKAPPVTADVRNKKMKQLLIILFLLPTFCAAQAKYTENELWNGVPAEKLPLNQVKLILKYEPPKATGFPGREILKPHGIGIGLKNIGTSLIEEVDVSLIFFNDTAIAHIKTPDGNTLDYKMQRGFRDQMNWKAIQPGENTWYMFMPIGEWFPEVRTSADGLYEMWWEVGTNTSEKLILRKNGQDISPENDSEQSVPGYPPQGVGSPEP